MMTVYASIPDRLLSNNLSCFWKHYYKKLRQDYPDSNITSNYTGDGCIDTCDVVIFLYEFREDESTQRDIKKCEELGKLYNFYMNFYTPDKLNF